MIPMTLAEIASAVNGTLSDVPDPQACVTGPAAQVATRGARRLKLRYLGTARNNAWLKNRTATLNLRNLISRGPARNNGVWMLA